MKRVLISGADGQLATDIIEVLNTPENNGFFTPLACNRSRLDVTDIQQLEKEFTRIKPHFYIHGASYHVVEEINKNPKTACDVNIASLHYLSSLCNEYNTTLINISTNYVFSGLKPPAEDFAQLEHYNETDTPHPVNLYGITKLAGEMVVSTSCEKYYNIRVSGLFGKTGSRAKDGKNFPYIIKENLENDGKAEVVADQIVNVGYTVDLATVIVEMMKQESADKYGLYHLVNEGECTWYEVAQEIGKILGYPKDAITPIGTKDFYTNLERPKDTSLNVWKVKNKFDVKIPTWQDGLQRFFKEIS
jgi:dTDP-4-dehydrorhamnose reductase|tara:strand:- start:532 stop:1443 length:912 start_codon:yes stop_codon:yes gene_type:complete